MKRKAFTLVEVLVATILLSLLLSTAMFAFKFFIKSLDSVELSLPTQAMSYSYIDHSLSGFYFYPIKTPELLKKQQYFFKFTKKSLTYITTTPLYYKQISVAKVECEKGYLYYYESPLYTSLQDYTNPTIISKQFKKTLLRHLESCSIDVKLVQDFNIPSYVTLSFGDTKDWIFSIDSNNFDYIKYINAREF